MTAPEQLTHFRSHWEVEPPLVWPAELLAPAIGGQEGEKLDRSHDWEESLLGVTRVTGDEVVGVDVDPRRHLQGDFEINPSEREATEEGFVIKGGDGHYAEKFDGGRSGPPGAEMEQNVGIAEESHSECLSSRCLW